MIISATTDIELDETVKYDALLSSGLIDIVRDTVINYDELYQDAMFMLNVVKMSEIMPNVESLNGLFNELPDLLKSMPPEEVERLEMMARVGMSNIKVGDFEGGN
jgi:hypothetical protein